MAYSHQNGQDYQDPIGQLSTNMNNSNLNDADYYEQQYDPEYDNKQYNGQDQQYNGQDQQYNGQDQQYQNYEESNFINEQPAYNGEQEYYPQDQTNGQQQYDDQYNGQAYDDENEPVIDEISENIVALEMLRNIVEEIDSHTVRSPYADELRELLTHPHLTSLLRSHDLVAAKDFDADISNEMTLKTLESRPLAEFANGSGSVQMVGIRKNKDEPLGITVREENNGDLAIARILSGSMIERQGLLHVGDIIKEINGKEIKTANQLQDIIRGLNERMTIKIIPSYSEYVHNSQFYVKTNYSFNPYNDNLIPCQEAGLEFKTGDILQIVDKSDVNWWQARHIDGRTDDKDQSSGLIPSQQLVLCGMNTKKKRNIMYQAKKNCEYDRNELVIYNEVVRMPPFQRKTIVLVGAQGVGRRSLKARLIKADASRFGSVIPWTSRPLPPNDEYEDNTMHHVNADDMHAAILGNELVEYGRAGGDYYGISFQSVRDVMESGRICVLDLSPKALKVIKTQEFMPYVIFIQCAHVETMRIMHDKAYRKRYTNKKKTELDFLSTKEENNRIRHDYRQYFDLTIVNDDMDKTYQKLVRAIENLSTKVQWVPVNWVY